MTEHRLDALLKPRSIALLGASPRQGSPGRVLAEMLFNSAFAGTVFAVNPGHNRILEKDCYPSLESLPARVDHVVIALANEHLEQALSDVVAHGARAATIYSSGILAEDSEPALVQRLRRIAQQAGLAICGLNGMGFYNPGAELYAGIFPRPERINKGGISYIAQSGSAFATLAHNGCRLGFNLCVSSGNELTTGVADYMDWCLEQQDTRVIALFLETIRDPLAFVEALQKANRKNIPVVVLKIGKSALAVTMALSHTGAIAGEHTAFAAMCRRYGVISVDDFDEMAAILMLLQVQPGSAEGGFAAIFESGGFRELISDIAEQLDFGFAAIEDSTRKALVQHLDPGLKPENPLDAWGSQQRFEERFTACLSLLMQDPNVAGGAFMSNFRDGYYLSEAIYRSVESVSRQVDKPVALVNLYSDLANTKLCERAGEASIPIIDGARESLLAFKRLFRYQQYMRVDRQTPPKQIIDERKVQSCQQRLASFKGESIGETEALQLLADFSIAVVPSIKLDSEAGLLEAANRLQFPLVLKTAEPGIHHKSDSQGVYLDIKNLEDLLENYRELANRLGASVVVSPMIEAGVEVALGTVNDAQFGPVIMVAAGGLLVELLEDRAFALCPVDAAEAESMLASLKLDSLLEGVRGRAAVNRQALVEIIVGLSQFAFAMREQIAEIDINPVLVNQQQAVAVDALIITSAAESPCSD